LPLAIEKPETKADTDNEKNGDGRGPSFHAAPQPGEIVAQFKHARFQRLAAF
jgi:hypothetical protein